MRRRSPNPSSASLVKNVSMNLSLSQSATMHAPPARHRPSESRSTAAMGFPTKAPPSLEGLDAGVSPALRRTGQEPGRDRGHEALRCLQAAPASAAPALGTVRDRVWWRPHLCEDEVPQEPRGLGDSKFFTDVFDGASVAAQEGDDVGFAGTRAKQLLVLSGYRYPVGIGPLVTDETVSVEQVVTKDLPVIAAVAECSSRDVVGEVAFHQALIAASVRTGRTVQPSTPSNTAGTAVGPRARMVRWAGAAGRGPRTVDTRHGTTQFPGSARNAEPLRAGGLRRWPCRCPISRASIATARRQCCRRASVARAPPRPPGRSRAASRFERIHRSAHSPKLPDCAMAEVRCSPMPRNSMRISTRRLSSSVSLAALNEYPPTRKGCGRPSFCWSESKLAPPSRTSCTARR